MAVKIYNSGGAINIEGVYPDIISINPYQFDWEVLSGVYYARDKIQGQSYELGAYTNVQNKIGVTFESDADLTLALNLLTKQNGNTSPVVITQMARIVDTTTLTTQAEIDDISIDVADASQVDVGSYIAIFDTTTNRFYQGKCISKNVNTVNLDSEIDSTLDIAGSTVYIGDTNMAIDGSVTPVTFYYRADFNDPLNIQINITRIIITMQLTGEGNLSLFGNITRLTKGLLFKQVGSFIYNIFNVKDNREIRNLGYDLAFDSTLGVSPDGVSSRITFELMGAQIPVIPGDNIIAKIQDNLSAITKLEITCEGYVVS